MIVKICGITDAGDALAAVEAGASALGFIFYRKSPRYIRPELAREITDQVPASVLKVGVFVDELPRELERIARVAGLDLVQLHGKETPARIPKTLRSWKALRVDAAWDRTRLAAYPSEAFLLDSPVQGQSFEWSWAAGLDKKIILAGGLDASNVQSAIRAVWPWGVDACSRIERTPGRKDYDKMRQFIRAAQTVMTT